MDVVIYKKLQYRNADLGLRYSDPVSPLHGKHNKIFCPVCVLVAVRKKKENQRDVPMFCCYFKHVSICACRDEGN